MRRRQSGAHARVYESIDSHPKTLAAARVLVEGVPGLTLDLAGAVVVRAVRRLVCWAIRESDTGRTGHLSDGALAAIAWPGAVSPGGPLWGAVDVGVIRRALRAVPPEHEVGFLWDFGRGQGRPGMEYLHEFQAAAWHALKDRPHYQGASLGDFDGNPLGRVRAAVPGRPAEPAAPASPSAPPGAPAVLASLAAAPAAPGDGRLAGGSPEVASRLLGRLRPPAAPKPLSDNGSARRNPEGNAFASSSVSFSGRTEKKNQGGPGVPAGAGWLGIPGAVFLGQPPAVATWVRGFGGFSKAGLYDGHAYVSRWTEQSGMQPAEGAEDPGISPGRALELLVPAAFDAVVTDLAAHLPQTTYPRTYTAKAIASRWSEVLAKMADEAAARRARFKTG